MTRISDNNLWRESATEMFQAEKFSGEITTDFVIIGGGFTGCSAAIEARKLGMDVCVLEAETVGHGGSGRNVGLVNAGLWTPPDEVEATMGEQGRLLNQALANGPGQVFQLIEENNIQCEATRSGTLHCAHSEKGFDDLQNRYEQQQKRNAPVELISAKDASGLTGASGIYGALLDRRAGTVQPMGYVKGLARVAVSLGAKIFENSPVREARRDGDNWMISTATGKVKAKYLLVAGNAYLSGDVENYIPRFTPVHYFQFATKPLGEDLLKEILPGKNGCWDTATVMSSFRLDAAGRLIMGSIGSLDSFGQSIHKNWIKRKTKAIFPQLSKVEFEYSWHGRIAMTDDHLPRLIQIGENALSMMGYNGRGIGPGTVMGSCIARYFSSNEKDNLPLKINNHYHQGFNKAKELYYETGASLTHLVKDH